MTPLSKTVRLFMLLLLPMLSQAQQNVGIGTSTPQETLDIAGNLNISTDSTYKIGLQTVLSTRGDDNLFVGASAGINTLNNIGIANGNTFVGTQTGVTNSQGFFNTFLGASAGFFNTTGGENAFLGTLAGRDNTIGAKNTFVGTGAGFNNTNGTNNTFIGYQASSPDGITVHNATAIGESAQANCNDCLILGKSTDNGVRVGIGTPSPVNQLDIRMDNSTNFGGIDLVNHHATGDVGLFMGVNGDYSGYIGIDQDDAQKLKIGKTSFVGSGAAIVIDNNNQVGINVNNPDNVLDVRFDAPSATDKGINIINEGDGDAGLFLGLNDTIEAYIGIDDLTNHLIIGMNKTIGVNSGIAITKDRKVSIGSHIDNIEARLQIRQSTNLPGGGIRYLSGSGTFNHWDTYFTLAGHFGFAYNGNPRAEIDQNTGAYNQLSDRRVKKNITPMTSVLVKVLQLRAATYHYKDTPDTEPKTIGFIAQEVEEIFPELVHQGEEYKALAYDKFAILAIKAIQEQQQIIEQLQEEKQALNQQTENMQTDMKSLKADMEAIKAMFKQ